DLAIGFEPPNPSKAGSHDIQSFHPLIGVFSMSRGVSFVVAVFLLGACAGFAPALRAQVERASIIGKITDTTGAAMAAVEVTVTNEATNTSVRVSSDDAGAFTAVNLIPGSYSVNA